MNLSERLLEDECRYQDAKDDTCPRRKKGDTRPHIIVTGQTHKTAWPGHTLHLIMQNTLLEAACLPTVLVVTGNEERKGLTDCSDGRNHGRLCVSVRHEVPYLAHSIEGHADPGRGGRAQ